MYLQILTEKEGEILSWHHYYMMLEQVGKKQLGEF